MIVKPIKTKRVGLKSCSTVELIEQFVKEIKEKSIVCVTSKVVSYCEGNVAKVNTQSDKEKLIKVEADYYVRLKKEFYGKKYLTIKRGAFIGDSGIDISASKDLYLLWPKDPQSTANQIRKYLIKKFKIENIGVIITDSKSAPLKRGATGVSIAYSGFMPLKGEKKVANLVDGLAAAAVLVMGEAGEQQPIALIEDIPFVKFTQGNPGDEELQNFYLKMDEDIFKELLRQVSWKRNERSGIVECS
jgi:F420-0:gamma-glutamyl ligase